MWQEFKTECAIGPFLMTQIMELYCFMSIALSHVGVWA